MDVDTRDLRFFLVASEELNVSRAARRLYVSQPLLSQRLARLEDRVGRKLFGRVHSGLTLTEAGAALVPFAERVVEHWRGAETALASHVDRAPNSVVLGLAVPLAPAVISRLGHELREAGVRLMTRRPPWTDPTAGLLEGTTDLALIRLPLAASSGVTSRVVARTPVHVVASDEYPLPSGTATHFKQIADEPIFAPPPVAGPIHNVLLGEARRQRPAEIAGWANSWEELIDGIATSQGIGLVPGDSLSSLPAHFSTRIVEDLPPVETALAWLPEKARPEVGQAGPTIRRAVQSALA